MKQQLVCSEKDIFKKKVQEDQAQQEKGTNMKPEN